MDDKKLVDKINLTCSSTMKRNFKKGVKNVENVNVCDTDVNETIKELTKISNDSKESKVKKSSDTICKEPKVIKKKIRKE